MAHSPAKRRAFMRYVQAGFSVRQACAKAGVSYSWGRNYLKGLDGASDSGKANRARTEAEDAGGTGPIPYAQLCERAKRGWDDFEYFRRVYLGHISMPWQVETAKSIIAALDTSHREYIVENVPPGAGKTTIVADLALWLTVRNRAVRGLIGSRVSGNAERMLNRIRKALESTTPIRARQDMIDRGLACDAEAALSVDYGLFKPIGGGDVWRADQFTVVKQDDEVYSEKETTWSSYGMDQGFLGNRFDVIFWDDVVDKQTVRTLEAVEQQREWWDDVAESRLEPGGVMMLVGQRVSAHDLYRYCLDKTVPFDEDAADEIALLPADQRDALMAEQPRIYQHIVYRAHYDDRCEGRETHKPGALAYPDGCLLDPQRLPWRDCYNILNSNPGKWQVWYQQEDTDLDSVLVKSIWVTGGTDPDTGETCVGVWDKDRDLCEIPEGLVGPKYSVATVDPSPTKLWAVQWWLATPEAANQVFLLDLFSGAMGGNELLDWDANNNRWYGLMEDWQKRSVEMGVPIKHWVIEINAAQRFLLQYDHVRRWTMHHKTSIIPHTTTLHKSDADLGVDMCRDWWRFGRIRLPGKSTSEARFRSMKLVHEATRYPHAYTTDQVMAHWFLFANLPKLTWAPKPAPVVMSRPGWAASLDSRSALRAV